MDIAIDLGSTRTRVYVQGKGKVLDEATVAAVDLENDEILAVGDKAYAMLGKTPSRYEAMYLLDSGVVSESELAENMIKILMRGVSTGRMVKPRVVACVPSGITEVEKRAVINCIAAIGVRKIYLLEAPKAAVIGCGLDAMSPRGKLVANFGGGRADVAVISLGGVSAAESTKKAGRKMDEEIVKYMRKTYNLVIGESMAEACKKAIGSLAPMPEERVFRVKGRDALGGLPKFVDVTSEEIREVLMEIALDMVEIVKNVLEQTPPELISDIHTDGIVLTGGLANLYGFPRLIGENTKIKVRRAENPQDCVISGCGKALSYINDFEKTDKKEMNPLMEAF